MNPALAGFPSWMTASMPTGVPIQAGFSPPQWVGYGADAGPTISKARLLARGLTSSGGAATAAALPLTALAVGGGLAAIDKAYLDRDAPTPRTRAQSIDANTPWNVPKGYVQDTRGIFASNQQTGAPLRYLTYQPKTEAAVNKQAAPPPPPPAPPASTPKGPAMPPPAVPPRIPAAPVLEELPYDPRAENAVRGALAEQRATMSEKYGKGRGALEDLLNQYQSQGSSFGGLMANQQALASINALQPAIAKTYEDEASQIGALPIMANLNQAIGEGNKPYFKSREDLFKEKLPSTQADTDLKKAHAQYYGQEAKGKVSELGLKRLQLLMGGKGQQTGGINPEIMLKAKEMLASKMITPEDYNQIIQASASYKQPTTALPNLIY